MSHTSERSKGVKSSMENITLNIPSGTNTTNLGELCTKRSSIKGQITKFSNFIDQFAENKNLTRAEYHTVTTRLDKFRETSIKFEDLQTHIESLNSSSLDAELEVREEMENNFALLTGIALSILDTYESKKNDAQCKSESLSVKSCCNHKPIGFKLPILKISNFDGTYYKWLEFRDTFTSLIHNSENIEPIHKFHYLNSYLEGEASRVISNLEVSAANYEEAWRLLCERYNNEKQLITNHLNSLCNIQSVPRDSSKSLRFLIDHVSKNLRALNTLGEPTESWDTLVIHLVSAKLDNSTSFKWEEHKNSFEKSPTLKDFFQFLKGRADILESIQNNKNERQVNVKNNLYSSFPKAEKSHTKSFAISAAAGPSSFMCVLCNGSHRLYDCASFLAKSVEDRTSEVLRLKLCLNCLRKGHSSRQCRLGPCSICKSKHNTLLHRESSQAVNTTNVHTTVCPDFEEAQGSESNDNLVTMTVSTSNSVLLSTAQVVVYNPITNEHLTVRALLDSGSQSSLITDSLKNKLNLTPQPTQVGILGIGNIISSNSMQRCSVKIKSHNEQYETNLTCLVLSCISTNLPNKTFNMKRLNIPTACKLADPTFNISAPVDMLIGADVFWQLIESEQINLGPNQPIMHKSKLGWLLAGPLSTKSYLRNDSVHCNLSIEKNTSVISNETLNDNLCKFWEIENIPQPVDQKTEEEIECENHFQMNTIRNEEGRFCVKLPLLAEPDCLGDSFKLAKKQFFALEKRFAKNPELKKSYSQFIQEYSALGHLSESEVLVPEQSYFIPHHAVMKPSSESTKLRVVFNGSAKTTSGYSVNDIQMVGPTIQDSLFNILIRFRQYAHVLSGDIEKMYRQVLIQDSHRDLQMILWRNHETDPLKSLRLNTVTYGYSSSSFLSTRCLWQVGEEHVDPKIKQIIQKDFLVDDLLTGCDSLEELVYIKKTIENALSACCFNLRKYRSNSPSVLVDSCNNQQNLMISSSSHTLGVGWNPNDDCINFPNSYEINEKHVTKRSILSDSCKVFDPLGLLSLLTIKPKILIQKLWVNKIDWDEPVPQEICQSWISFVENMKHIQTLQIPRHVLSKSPVMIELHCFCDASQNAYATCIYLRSVSESGDVTCRLLCAKARVASVKPTTIPRLELCACLLGAQLAGAVCRTLRCVIDRKIFWTDSSIALSWLSMRFDKLKTFVANRVGTILELTSGSEWRHVPTQFNPADLASRGIDASKINDNKLWWNGPTFLCKPETLWPSANLNKTHPKNDLPEIKVNIISCEQNPKQNAIDFDRYSKLKFLQRSFAYVLRFIHNCKNSSMKRIGVLQPEELSLSFEGLVRLSQEESFNKELAILQSNKALCSKSPILTLSPYLDEKKILRVGGRIDSSCYTYEKRHPVLLHAKHRLTKLLFQQEHLRLLHAGPQLLLSSIREIVWPIAGRDLARTTARQCVVCRKASGKTTTPIMGMLPKQRVNPDYPFASTGVDFAGPFLITDRKGRGCKISKCYLCIFVCLRYKCLHLEAVSELSKDAFILSLRRFISRRGKPTEIFSDNGRNFVAACREISEFLKCRADDIASFSAEEGIKFKFQPAYAPHFGGLWEAGVKSAKFHLSRILGNTHLTFEELATLFGQIEAVLNSRPLCPLSPSPDDYQSLTPGHFLIGRPLMSLPSQNLEQAKISRLDRYQRLELLRQHFWNRWQREYVAELQQKHKWRVPSKPLREGDLVLLKEENTAPMHWKLGRISALFPGRDDVARVAEVKTTTGTYRRGVKYLCPLLDPDDDHTLEPAASKAREDVPAHH